MFPGCLRKRTGGSGRTGSVVKFFPCKLIRNRVPAYPRNRKPFTRDGGLHQAARGPGSGTLDPVREHRVCGRQPPRPQSLSLQRSPQRRHLSPPGPWSSLELGQAGALLPSKVRPGRVSERGSKGGTHGTRAAGPNARQDGASVWRARAGPAPGGAWQGVQKLSRRNSLFAHPLVSSPTTDSPVHRLPPPTIHAPTQRPIHLLVYPRTHAPLGGVHSDTYPRPPDCRPELGDTEIRRQLPSLCHMRILLHRERKRG